MGSPCLFARQQALKMGYFYWLILRLIINTAEIENRDCCLFAGLYFVFNSLLLDRFQICRSKTLLFQLFPPFSIICRLL